jgi:hypothetical protein
MTLKIAIALMLVGGAILAHPSNAQAGEWDTGAWNCGRYANPAYRQNYELCVEDRRRAQEWRRAEQAAEEYARRSRGRCSVEYPGDPTGVKVPRVQCWPY